MIKVVLVHREQQTQCSAVVNHFKLYCYCWYYKFGEGDIIL